MAGKVDRASLNFWKSDWFVGLAVGGVVLALGNAHLLQSLESKAYDLGVGMVAREASDRIAVIAIDRPSLDRIGAWPWSREVFAGMIEQLAGAQAKVIATTVPLAEPRRDPGLEYIRRLGELHRERQVASVAAAAEQAATVPVLDGRKQGEMKVGAGRASAFAPPVPSPVITTPLVPLVPEVPAADSFVALLAEAEASLDGDRRLAAAISNAGNVVLPVRFRWEIADGAGHAVASPLPAYLRASAVKLASNAKHALQPVQGIDTGVAEIFAAGSAAVGHVNLPRDADGVLRGVPLVLADADVALPALALQVAAKSLAFEPKEILTRPGETVRLGKQKIATDERTRLLSYFYRDSDGTAAFSSTSFFDILSGKVPVERFRDKIVLIGPTVVGFDDMLATPAAGTLPAVLVLAHAVSNIVSGHYFVAPAWGGWVEMGVFVLITLYLMFLLPHLSRLAGAGVGVAMLVLVLGVQMGLLVGLMMWVPLVLPATLLILGHLGLAAKRCLLAGEVAPASPAPAMFRAADVSVADVSVALPSALHRDTLVIERSPRVIPREEEKTLALDFSGNIPEMFGHYRVEREIGKGAMGLVYLGHDTRDNRQVALKTLALAQEFDADVLADVRERFFREAETVGRLEHPNIVRMFGVGEEWGLAYIAMELLAGQDLVSYTRPNALLPPATVASIIARVADALDYAHGHHVVHRDIKPANIMVDLASDQVKVMDFGVARITDASKTRTGMVLGSPSYMSPEQLAGKKIDGRSDLFSLGITLYQLCAGQLPFAGETMAKLMFRIAGEPHPDIRGIVPGMPACLVAVIDKALTKDPERRYQNGAAMAQDLRACLIEM